MDGPLQGKNVSDRLKGPAYRHGLFQVCYVCLRGEKLRDLMDAYRHEPPTWKETWDDRIVFRVLERVLHPKQTLFETRCVNGGHPGDHGGGKRVPETNRILAA